MSHWAKAMRLFLPAAVKSQYWGAGVGGGPCLGQLFVIPECGLFVHNKY